jgi:signal transduction histidine kinase/CheY-like chemotaxis protein
MSEQFLAALGRALAFCAAARDSSLEGLIERAAWELHHETSSEFCSLACIVRRRDGSSFVARPRELAALPAESLLGMLVEEGGIRVSCRVRDHALDTIRFIDARFRTSILVRISVPQMLLPEGEGALWFGLQGVATPKKVELAQQLGKSFSEWLTTYAPVVVSMQAVHGRVRQLQDRLAEMTSIAHDARAPVGALQYLLVDLVADYPEVHGEAARLRQELAYVDALLGKFSPNEAPRSQESSNTVDVCRVVQRVCQRFVPEITSYGGRFVYAFPEGASVSAASPELDFERLVSNIIGNAVRYAGKDEIRIEVVSGKTGAVSLFVSDRGPGVPRSVVDALRLGVIVDGTVQGASGWGVGLVSCKRRLKELGGDLTVESTSGGSTVAIILPQAHASRIAELGGKDTERESASVTTGDDIAAGCELVLIDDDTDHTESLERVLKRAHITTRSFSSVSAAMEHIQRSPHARVVCDAHMPDGGAEKLLHMVTALQRIVPCAVMSGESSDDALYRYAALGAREFFPKPAPIERLIAWARD